MHKLGPGDSFKSFLEGWGITEERYKSFKKYIGLPPSCDCPKRKDWLNRIPQAFKEGGVRAALKEQQAWKDQWSKPR